LETILSSRVGRASEGGNSFLQRSICGQDYERGLQGKEEQRRASADEERGQRIAIKQKTQKYIISKGLPGPREG